MKYKGYELMQAIVEKKIKKGANFKTGNGTEMYFDGSILRHKRRYCDVEANEEIGMSWLRGEFELIEDKEEMNIQEIEEQTTTISFNFHKDSYTANEIDYNFEKITEYLNIYNNKQNELIRAIKQIDKQIHCKVCEKELAVKYGVCEKCYENVNEDVR